MERRYAHIIMSLVLAVSASGADEKTEKTTAEKKQAESVLEPKSNAQRRMEQNLDVVVKNIDETRKNIEISKANIKTIESELASLGEMEKDHLGLKTKFAAFIAGSNKTIVENERAVRELKEYEKKRELASKNDKGGGDGGGAATAKERDERLRWETTAKEKLAKIRQMHEEIMKNLSDIGARRVPLEQQLRDWNRRQREFETQLTQFEKRKDTLEKMTAQ